MPSRQNETWLPLVTRRLLNRACRSTLLVSFVLVACGARTDLKPGALEGTGADDDGVEPIDDPEPMACQSPSFDYSALPATVLLLLDRSGSMNEPFGSDTRWNVVHDALFRAQDGLVARLGDSARFGLAFYTSLNGFAGGTCPIMDYTSIVLGDPDLLSQAFDSTSPLLDGDTPTGEAVLEALDWLDQDATPGPRYLVLITDGEPDTCSQPDPQNGQQEALQAAREAHERGVEMYVVGVSLDVGVSHLQQMANVAQGVRANAKWGQDADAIEPIVAASQDDVLAAQIQGALGDVRTCTIVLDQGVDLEGTFVVTLDGREVPTSQYSIENGKLVLSGETCARVLDDAETLDVQVPCLAL